MSRGEALQTAVYAALTGDAAVAAKVGAEIYDGVPENAGFPRITFGPSDSLPVSDLCPVTEEHTLQLDVWSRDAGSKWPCRSICEVVKDALHLKGLALPGNLALSEIRVPSIRVMDDPDGLTVHGVIRVTALIEIHG